MAARAFVTGGSGFIGQVLVRRLLDEGHAVRVLARSEESAARASALGAVILREFVETLFGIYGVDTPIPDLDAETAAREVPVPARWFLGQPRLLRTDKAVAELGYKPIVSHGAGLHAVRNAVAAGRA